MSQQGSSPQRSELVSFVAWVEIVGAGFGLLAALVQLAFIALARGYVSAPLSPQSENQVTVLILVAGSILLGSVLVLLAGVGLRRRYNWARRLTVGLCYLGCLGVVGMFGLQWWAVSYWVNAPSSFANPQMFSMLGFLVKAFLVSFMVIGVAILLWVASRLNTTKVLAEFLPPPPPVAAEPPASTPQEPS